MCNWIDTDYSRSYAMPSYIFADCWCVNLAEKITNKLIQRIKSRSQIISQKIPMEQVRNESPIDCCFINRVNHIVKAAYIDGICG